MIFIILVFVILALALRFTTKNDSSLLTDILAVLFFTLAGTYLAGLVCSIILALCIPLTIDQSTKITHKISPVINEPDAPFTVFLRDNNYEVISYDHRFRYLPIANTKIARLADLETTPKLVWVDSIQRAKWLTPIDGHKLRNYTLYLPKDFIIKTYPPEAE